MAGELGMNKVVLRVYARYRVTCKRYSLAYSSNSSWSPHLRRRVLLGFRLSSSTYITSRRKLKNIFEKQITKPLTRCSLVRSGAEIPQEKTVQKQHQKAGNGEDERPIWKSQITGHLFFNNWSTTTTTTNNNRERKR